MIARAEAYRSLQRSRIERMRAYAETRGCRRQFLLRYFGESEPSRCGDCDTCRDGSAAEEEAQEAAAVPSPFQVEEPVEHEAFGPGRVMSLDGEEITVVFDGSGYRTLHLPTVLEQELLRSSLG